MEQANQSPRINMVHHVHWDPMWYSSYQEYRIRLYRLMKKLLRILETNPEYGHFMFDGQVSAIEDYLAVAPEDEGRIKKFVRDGRLAVGPWFIQPEEFLISGESLVRNLQLGIRRARELGGVMAVSYLCDPVGHIAQLPQILSAFGLKYFCASRGIHDGDKIMSSEFVWEAPDGSEVLTQSMPIGYSHHLPPDQEGFERDLARKAALIGAYNSTGFLFFAQGADHGEPMEEALAFAQEHNRRVGWRQIVFTTLEAHMAEVELHRARLPRYRGELRHSRNMPMLTGVLTTRREVKQANADVQTGLEKWLEPFAALYHLLGGEYPAPFLDLAWKHQIQNSFHDCIYGAHADHVTADVMHGYKQVAEIIAWQTNEALHGIARRAGDGARERLVLFNPTAQDQRNVVLDCEMFFPGDTAPRVLSLCDGEGNALPFQIDSVEKIVRFASESGNVTGECFGGLGFLVKASLQARHIPAMGYAVCYVKQEKAGGTPTDLKSAADGCENGCLRMKINANGTLDVLDKATGQLYQGLHFFEDSGDRGDQYNYSATVPAGVLTSRTQSARVFLECAGPVKAVYRVELDLKLPECLDAAGQGRSESLIGNPVTTYITVRAGSPMVEFHTVVDNRSRDHRLTLGFPTGIRTDTVESGGHFDITARPVALPHARDWNERPSGFHPHHRFVRIGDGGRSFAFLDRGLTEHSVSERGDLHVTLLRCTSHLSKDTLPERHYGHAGPGMPTPLGQEIGRHEYDYAILAGQGLPVWEAARHSAGFAAPVRALHIAGGQPGQGDLPDRMSLLKIAGDGVMLSAVKIGESGSLIVRLYNNRNVAVEAEIAFLRPVKRATLTDLMERPLQELPSRDGILRMNLGPHKIVTISADLEDSDGEQGV